MKYFSNVFILIFVLFTGCAVQQEQVVEIDVTKVKKEDKKIIKKDDAIESKKEEINIIPQEISSSEEEINIKQRGDRFNIAVIYPSQVVGKYAIDGVNSITSYLLYKDVKFSLKTYDSMSENKENIEKIVENLDLDTYDHVVLFMTKTGLEKFVSLEKSKDLNIYAPLVNKNEITFDPKNIVFGGIDYNQQFDKLFTISDMTNLSEFHDSVSLGQILSYKLDDSYDMKYKFQKRLVRNRINYESFLKKNKFIKDTSILLNTPIVQTSILLSQMRAYEIEYDKLLSTQINYTPLILSLTQRDDRKNMIIASSIGQIDETLIEYGAILNTDFVYNWVNYSTLIGIDYLHGKRFETDRDFKNEIVENQVLFDVKLYESGKYSFKPYTIKAINETIE